MSLTAGACELRIEPGDMYVHGRFWVTMGGGALLACLLFQAVPARGDCILDVFSNPVPPFSTNKNLFPNWQRAPAAAFSLSICDDVTCSWGTNGPIVGITIMNYGSATGGPGADITGLYFQLVCDATNPGILPMTYAGDWIVGGPAYPAWTWAGSIPWGGDPCAAPGGGGKGCLCVVSLYVYADIGSCPTDGATVQLGPGFNDVENPGWPGGIYDSLGCNGPWGKTVFDPLAIRYVLARADRDMAAPGDAVNYTIYYGKPGTGSINTLWITDSVPAFMHYAGASTPADPGWDPDPGPPLRLRWTINGPLATAGGPTSEITFAATVDWGNGESFEPGSGDVAVPEGAFLLNRAHLSWEGGGCASGRVSGAASTVAKRYLFWMIGDNDILFAGRPGIPDDEMTYETFVKNVSTKKTWWNVSIWDTVPPEVDVWSPGYGFDDPCSGWTMTPTGCAAASPGRIVTGAVTNLTWHLDMPPAMTLALRWRARVRPTTPANSTALNVLSLLELGRTGVVEGTGHGGTVARFMHEAPIILRIMYTSYVGMAAGGGGCSTPTYFISFYPLNKASDFQLYYKFCCGPKGAVPCDPACTAFAVDGGVSPRIDVFGGTCTGGPAVDWEMGCRAERTPARYIPSAWNGANPSAPYNLLHKLVSNSPVIWEVSTCLAGGNQDATTYAGTTSLSYCGYMAYAYCRVLTYPDVADTLYVANTNSDLQTTVHVFSWDPPGLKWEYQTTADIFKESQWAWVPLVNNHYRIVSSQTRIMVQKGFPGIGIGGSYNDFGTVVPNRENGNLVNDPAAIPSTFYLWGPNTPPEDVAVIVGNVGAAAATYRIHKYTPFDQTLPSPSVNIPFTLVDKGGSWAVQNTHTVGPAAPVPGPTGPNPHVYGPTYDTSVFIGGYAFYKVELLAGGPIQIVCGLNPYRGSSGGAVMHSSNPAGKQVGQEFWFNETANVGLYGVSVFCPKVNMGMRMASSDGYLAQYTTTDTDECITFMALSDPGAGNVRNYRLWVPAAGNPGDAIMQYHDDWTGEKFYSAPFLCKGTFYSIITPPVVYSGVPFWITVVVMDTGGGTKADYCGTSSFTSTDPAAQIGGLGMDSFNYTWNSGLVPCGASPFDNGVRLFMAMRLTKLGLQSMVATDIFDGSINGLATLMVVGVDLKLEKMPKLLLAASSDTVQFRVCWSNYSAASAFSLVITDAVPVGMTFVPEASAAGLSCGNTDGVTLAVSYSILTQPTPPSGDSFVTGNPVAGTRWLRWTVPVGGVETTGCACFRAQVQ